MSIWPYNLMVNNIRSKYIFMENNKIEILFSNYIFDGVTSRTSDCQNIYGRIRGVIDSNLDGTHVSLETIFRNTIAVIKLSIEHNIEFTYDLEQNNKINFLNFILTRTNDTFQTTAYRKRNRNGVYGTLLHEECGNVVHSGQFLSEFISSAQLKNFYTMN